MRQAVILVGGKGTRLGSLSGDRPKPFVDTGSGPFIDHLLYLARCQGIEDVILLAGHSADWITQHFQTQVSGLTVRVSVEPEPLGTAGALLPAAALLDEQFLMLNGDSLLDGNWSALYPLLGADAVAVIATRQVDDTARYGKVSTDGSRVLTFAEKGATGPGQINAGIYAMRRDDILGRVSGACSMEQEVLPALVAEGKVKAAPLGGYFIDIGLPDTLALARHELTDKLRRPAVIFDRDNTLVEDKGYVHKVEDLVWMDGAKEAIRACNQAGYRVFVATNQAGIARGYYDVTAMHRFHSAMQHDLHAVGAHIDGFYHCPHHPDGTVEGLAAHCECRKPATGMLRTLFADHNLIKDRSVMIGDRDKDVTCGRSFGIAAARFEGGSLLDFCQAQGVFA